jgi:hypothetical protein
MEAEPTKSENASTNGWDEIELSRDRPSARAFWSAVLSFASAGHATAVSYRPAGGEDCLKLEADSQTVFMVPPPAELRSWLLKEGRRLAGVSLRRRLLLRLKSQSTNIYVKLGEHVTEWRPYKTVGGLRFESSSGAAAQLAWSRLPLR